MSSDLSQSHPGARHGLARAPARALNQALRPLLVGLAHTVDHFASLKNWRRAILATVEIAIAVVSSVAATAVIYSGAYWQWGNRLLEAVLILASAKLLVGLVSGAFTGRWRFVGIRDALMIARSALIAEALGFLALRAFVGLDTDFRLVVADTTIYLLLSSVARLSARWLHEWERRASAMNGSRPRRVAIIGAGEAGSALIKSLLASPKMFMDPVAAVDDNPNKRGARLHGVPILGPVSELGAIVTRFHADEILIAIPSATTEQVGPIVDACVATKLPFRIAPDPEDVLGDRAAATTLRDVQPSDLLGRPQAELNLDELEAELKGARVVITGAAGSIGSELVRQLARFEPELVYLVDRNENDLYFLCEELERRGVRAPHVDVILDVRDQRRLRRVVCEAQPTHVFHAAAFKHVPLMEYHLLEAVENNVLGTWAALEAARVCKVGKFVLISTDKAVRPSSVMGATKRFAEVLVAEATRNSEMHGVIVRFGNVIGSNGSVVPLFERQISDGGPVTVTSREASRYFMTTVEAVQLVLQAVCMPESDGKVAILDMGTPIRIWDLAERLIRIKGLRPGADIEIVETGLRPGEKLHEELWWQGEDALPSSHPKIMLGSVGEIPGGASALISAIRALVESENEIGLREMLEHAVGLTNGHSAPQYAVIRGHPRQIAAVEASRATSAGPV